LTRFDVAALGPAAIRPSPAASKRATRSGYGDESPRAIKMADPLFKAIWLFASG